MRFPKHNGLNQKKGISSIVGGIFFLVLMTSGFTVYYVALDSQAQMLHTQQVIADYEVAKIREKFVVAASSDSGDSNRLSLQVVNTGNNPIKIADVWIINKTDAAEPAAKYDVDYRDASIPVGYSGNILSNTPLYLISDIYGIKVISSIGTIQAVEYDVAGGSNILSAQMVAIPQDVRFGENVTVILMVTNTGDFDVKQVRANTNFDVSPDQCRDPPNLIFGGPSNLAPSQSTMFFWDCILDPPLLNTITFTGNATGLLSGVSVDSNDASDSVVVRDFTSAGGTLILEQELLNRPEIFMTVPSPFGDDFNDKGLWGVNLVNPTPFPMEVSKVTVTALTARPQKQDKLFDETSCPIITVPPTPDFWSCPVQNQLMWKNFATPIIIPPSSVFPFAATVGPGTLAGAGDILETILVSANVFTTLGQFGKTSYGSSMVNNDSALVNVFLSSVKDSTAVANIMINQTGILAQVPVTFYATIADFTSEPDYRIDSGSRIIINVPRDWTFSSPAPFDPDFSTTETTFLGQTQLIGELNVNIDNSGKSLEFVATPPCVENPTMYVMYILADGVVSDLGVPQVAVGPLAEIILQVVPNGLCT
ncbi:MAG: hypothetical protein IH792_05770 [Thaumarchaeota archaeon]|nr:hypothetical protein [Nitrososphaerota archaeon]